ncbi:MAG: S41 family peptidase [Planctomycetes bacterium]|nr:S41 family peptidase [Planctomycetota bacterium]
MMVHIQRTVAVLFLAVASLGGTRSLADEALEIYPIGSEQRVVDSLEASTPKVSVPPGLNILDSAYAAVMAKAYPKPHASTLAAQTIAAVCEEFRRQTGKELPAARCESLSAAAARAGGFENVLRELQTESPQELDRDRLIEAGLVGMLSGPQPPAWLVTKDFAAQFKEMILARKEAKLEQGFVGLNLANWPTANVSPGGPAQEAGLQNGDVIVRIDSVDANSLRSGVEAKNVLAGPAGGTVTLTIRRGNQKMEFRLRRASLGATQVRAERLKPGILRISVPMLEGSGIAARVERLLADSEESNRTLLLDLRDNPGGRLEEANAIANLFLDGKLLEILELREGRRIAFRAAAGRLALRVVVLVNRQTGSSAEILAMALRDNAATVIVGEPTAGFLYGKEFEPLKDGRALWIRIAPLILSPSGKDYVPGGVAPDIPVPDDKRNGHDNILDQALRHALEAP